MKLSTRSTYGVRAMMALAANPRPKPLMVKEIAEHNNLPPTYLEQLMVQLRKSGLLSATRGAHGGYTLARPASDITLADIIVVLEGPLQLTECPSGVGCCGHPETCALQEIWTQANDALQNVFGSVTLAQLLERQRQKETGDVLMYSI
jgi:Rrf2 family cysteine metabolism transcriptional repressor